MFNRKLKQRVRELELLVERLIEVSDQNKEAISLVADEMGYEIVVDFCDDCGKEFLTLEKK